MAPRTQRGDLPLAAALLFLGAGTVAVALRRFPAAFIMFPAFEGALTMGIVAFLLALASGLTLRGALAWTSPALIVQVAFAVRLVPSFVGAVGLELAVVGAVGVAMALFERAAAQQRSLGADPTQLVPAEHGPERGRAQSTLADAE